MFDTLINIPPWVMLAQLYAFFCLGFSLGIFWRRMFYA